MLGRMIAIYTSQYMWRLVSGNDKSLKAYPLWVACWRCSTPLLPIGWKSWVFWRIAPLTPDGMSATFDGNVFNGTDDDAIFWSLFRGKVKQHHGHLEIDQMCRDLRAHHTGAQNSDFFDCEFLHDVSENDL